MRISKIGFLGLILTAAATARSGDPVATENVKARLISETMSVGPGQAFWVALELNIKSGWHTYWRNPGDSGRPTQLVWDLPKGFSAEDIVWPTPHRFELPPLVNYGYSGQVMHLVRITAPAVLNSNGANLAAKATWLVCSDVCIPESVNLRLALPVSASAGAIDTKDEALFVAARAQLPTPAPATTSAHIDANKLVISLGKEWGQSLATIQSLSFFPYDEGSIEYGAPQTFRRTADGVTLALKLGYQPPKVGPLRGILLTTTTANTGTDHPQALEIAANLSGTVSTSQGEATETPSPRFAPLPSATGPSGAAASAAAPPATALPVLLLFAVLGGLILNLMPCVFPVLSIKALGLVEQAKKSPAAVRTKGLTFAAGVISSMLVLASILLALRAGGEQIGWGFQLQSPLFVTLMIYLLLAVGLNLSGVFEFGGGLAGVGDSLTQGDGLKASFFTGVLTTLVATPCTAPFMAAAVGAALTQSPFVALCIFAALGVGLSFPYVLLSFAPKLRAGLPKPGAWMDTLKQVFAFPMYGSAAWLLWVLAQQSSIGLAAALAGSILIALAAWAYRRATWLTIAAALLALVLPFEFADNAGNSPGAHAAANTADEWRPYDAAKVAELKAAGQPLLVNFTASWCLTCLVNERNAFADPAVRQTFHRKGVTLMKGDWTNRDPAITQGLAAFGRGGVPLYVVYNSKPGSSEPVILPQLLTPTIVQTAFADVPDREAAAPPAGSQQPANPPPATSKLQ